MRFHHRSLALCLAVPALLAAGCGGGGGTSDADQITTIVNEVAADPLAICDHLSDQTLQKVFQGGADACRRSGQEANAQAGTGHVDIKSVKVDGDTATAEIVDKDGKQQTLKFTRDGDRWVAAIE